MPAAKMHRVACLQMMQQEGRHGNDFGLKILHRQQKTLAVLRAGKNREVRIAAKLRRAVQYASLAPHQQAADLALAHRRKDFAYRVRDQGRLLVRGMSARDGRFPSSVEPESTDTTRPTPRRQALPHGS